MCNWPYVISSQVGITPSASGAEGNFEFQKNESENTYSRLRMLEVGRCYFTTFTQKQKLIQEIYGEVGMGIAGYFTAIRMTLSNRHKGQYHIRFKLRNIFIQPSFAFVPRRSFEIAVGTRISGIFYSVKESSFTNKNEGKAYDDMQNLKAKKLFTFLEPTFKLTMGRKVRFWISFDGSFAIMNSKISNLANPLYPNLRCGTQFKLKMRKDPNQNI